MTAKESKRAAMGKRFAETCPAPWISLLVHQNETYAPCCFIRIAGDDMRSHRNLASLWNSPYMRRLRELIAAGRYEEAGCPRRGCYYLNGRGEPPYDPQFIMSNLSDGYLATERMAEIESDFRDRKPLVVSRPAILQTDLLYSCNLRCVMCPQDHFNPHRIERDTLSMLLEDPGCFAAWVEVGGEVFLDRRFVDFFAQCDLGRYPNLAPVVFTNGMLLDEETLGRLTASALPNLVFSIDGATAATYNRLRVRSDFEKVMANMRRAIRLYAGRGAPDRIIWHYVVMRSTLNEVALAHRLSRELGVKLEIDVVVRRIPDLPGRVAAGKPGRTRGGPQALCRASGGEKHGPRFLRRLLLPRGTHRPLMRQLRHGGARGRNLPFPLPGAQGSRRAASRDRSPRLLCPRRFV